MTSRPEPSQPGVRMTRHALLRRTAEEVDRIEAVLAMSGRLAQLMGVGPMVDRVLDGRPMWVTDFPSEGRSHLPRLVTALAIHRQ